MSKSQVVNAMVDMLILGFDIIIDDEGSLLFAPDAVWIGGQLHAATEDSVTEIIQNNSNTSDGIEELLLSINTSRRLILDWDLLQFKL